jgi:hypothetical protein
MARRRGAAAEHLRLMQRAVSTIQEVGVSLDHELASESQAGERLRLLRRSTALMTRAGNDAVQAYRSAIRALDGKQYGVTPAQEPGIREELRQARREFLLALEVANSRYPWAPTALPASSAGIPQRRPG